MRKWLQAALCSVMILGVSQEAASMDGHALLSLSSSQRQSESFGYIMYVAGVWHGVARTMSVLADFGYPPIFCTGTEITNADVADVVRIYLRHNSDQLHMRADEVVVLALMRRFPCNE